MDRAYVMENENEKLVSKVAEVFGKVCALAYQVNMKTEYAVFLDFSGHVDKFEITFGRDRNLNYCDKVMRSTVRMVQEPNTLFAANTLEYTVDRLEQMALNLQNILENGELNTDDLPHSVETEEKKIYHI